MRTCIELFGMDVWPGSIMVIDAENGNCEPSSKSRLGCVLFTIAQMNLSKRFAGKLLEETNLVDANISVKLVKKLCYFKHTEIESRRWRISKFRQSKLLFYTKSHSKIMKKYISRLLGKPGFAEMPKYYTNSYHIARNVLSLIGYGYNTGICMHILIHCRQPTHFECIVLIFCKFVYWILQLRQEIVGRNFNIRYIDGNLLLADLKRKKN